MGNEHTTHVTAADVTMARIEGKLDAYAARTSAIEEKTSALDERLRAVESRPHVTPTGLLAALVGTVTAAGGLVAFIQAVAPL